ncbi:hypothetical protein BABINDRAFT_10355 [Babjeviella inositovora NRRL Y-12698]|uniref:3beta-hydroxysteroid 3-dehydrogenase n=1 Tax=Babjeviella inositovora NRRL Y-12698 TaxID=984486 RepID=A0A1E3QIE1_9ASCO|nr:uncharacterized protein BABINDRAFT_10355 [Babjeviella inositovora NRRL Y-12698]ODQ77204.1 hypothetical protein BABINDRAFT_10355 [Babjeviella inositovora NRRL Y-12698]
MSKVAVIAGTGSHLGLNIAYRLLETLPPATHLTLVVTSRTLPKVKDVISTIKAHAAKTHRPGVLEFDYLLLDLTNMVSVLAAAHDLQQRYAQIDYFFVNAAQGVYDGIDWLGACREICANPIAGVTQPMYKIQRVGVTTPDGMGLVFQANVFGPYYLLHKIKPLLTRACGRIIWVSSVMSLPKYLSFNDLELIRSPVSYEGSKRLIDLLHLASYDRLLKEDKITQYVTHPGIFVSMSFGKFLNVFTYYGMLLMFYLARWYGSPWHCISGYTSANAVIYAAFAEPKTDLQSIKYGSACRRGGSEYVLRSEIEGTGKDDVLAYFEKLTAKWDEKLKDQIVETRLP